MFRTFAAAASVAALGLAAAPALAQTAPLTGAYGTLGYSHVDDGDLGLGTIQGRLGYKFHPNFAVEGEGALRVDSDRRNIGGTTVDTKVKHSAAAYAVGMVPLSDKLDLFVRGGYGTTKAKATSAGVSVSDSNDSWNYGVGAQYFFDGQNGLRADYTRHDFRGAGNGSADVWGVSYVRRF